MKKHIQLERVLADLAESDRRKAAIKSVASLLSKFVKEAACENESLKSKDYIFLYEGAGIYVVWTVTLDRLGRGVLASPTVACGGFKPIRLGKGNIPLDQVQFIYRSLEPLMEWARDEFGLEWYFHSLAEAAA